MICYKKYSYDPESEKIYQYLLSKNKIFNNEVFYSDLDHKDFFKNFSNINSFLESHKVSCIGIGLIKIFYNKVAIHTDNSAVKGGTVRLNWPVVNCEYSETLFYKNINGIKERKLLDNGIVFYKYQDEDCEEIDKVCLNSPTALDVSIPHKVWCKKFPRISLSFHLRPNPTWLLL